MFHQSSVAIDRGSTTTRVLWLRGAPGRWQVAAAREFPRSGGGTGALVSDLRAARVPVKNLVMGVSGEDATLRYLHLPHVPEWRLETILRYETEEMIERSGEPLSSDYCRLDILESRSDDQILLVGLGKDRRLEPCFEEIDAAGGRVARAFPSAVALYHAYRQSTDAHDDETVLLADVGAQETQIVVVIDGRLVFARSVHFGGAQIDETIASTLEIREAQARILKEKANDDRIPGELRSGFDMALRSALGQLVRVLQSSISFCKVQTKIPELEVDRVFLSGGSAKLELLPEFVGHGLGVPALRLEPPATATPLPGDPREWVVAWGLAVGAAEKVSPQLDLLPEPFRARRDFRERTVFSVAAGSVLILGLLIAASVAFIANFTANAAQEEIERQKQIVLGYQQQEATARNRNQIFRSQIDRVQEELGLTFFQGELLALLRRELPSAISIERFALQRDDDEGQLFYEIRLTGRADNAELDAIEHVQALNDVLKQVPGVVRATAEIDDPLEDGSYPFEIVVSPHEKNRGKRPRTRNPRGG